jgi:hypothetical protein
MGGVLLTETCSGPRVYNVTHQTTASARCRFWTSASAITSPALAWLQAFSFMDVSSTWGRQHCLHSVHSCLSILVRCCRVWLIVSSHTSTTTFRATVAQVSPAAAAVARVKVLHALNQCWQVSQSMANLTSKVQTETIFSCCTSKSIHELKHALPRNSPPW